MGTLRIPERHQEGLKLFAGLSAESRTKLLAFLDTVPFGKFPPHLQKVVANQFSVSESDAYQILNSLYSIFTLRETGYLDANAVASDILDALSEIAAPNSLDKAALTKDFQQLLSSNGNYFLTFKATDIESEREKLVNSFRIFSDYRPVFSDGKDVVLSGSLVIHTLRISYDENNETKESFFALDEDDLKSLKKLIDRTELKSNIMKAAFNKAGIKILELEGGD